MTAPDLPADLEAAFTRLDSAIAARAENGRVDQGATAEQLAEMSELREKLAYSEAEVARLNGALEKSEARRAEAAARLDAAAEKLDGLLGEPEGA